MVLVVIDYCMPRLRTKEQVEDGECKSVGPVRYHICHGRCEPSIQEQKLYKNKHEMNAENLIDKQICKCCTGK